MSGRINYSNLSDSLKEKLNSANMSKGDNIEYVAENAMKTFASDNDGYIDNFYLEGKTLINISTLGSINGTNADGVVRIRFYDENIIDDSFIHYKRFSGKTFTCYNFTEANIHYVCRNRVDEWAYSFVVEPYSSKVVDISNDLAIVGVDFTPEDGWSNADLSIYNESMFMIIEGEQSPNQPYFKGSSYVGGSTKGKSFIEIMTYNKNLLNKEDFVVGSTASIEGDEFIIDGKVTNRITHKNPIPLEFLRRYELRYRTVDINAFIFQLDENKQVLQRHTWDRYDYVQLIHPNAKYVQIIFSYKDGRDMTIEDFDNINPILADECDKCEFEYRIFSLPNGVKDTIVKKGDEYKIQSNVRTKIIAGGGDNIDIISSQELTNTIYFRVYGDYGDWSPGAITSDLFATDITPHGDPSNNTGLWFEDREGLGNVSGEGLRIRINKNRLSSLDVAGIKQWLNKNNITIYYMNERATYNLPFISNRTYEPSTTLVVNTPGAIQPDVCTFETNNNLLNVIERLYDIVSDTRKGNFNSEPLYVDTDVNKLRGYGKICHGRKLKNAPVSSWCTIITIFNNIHNHGYQICIPWDVGVNISERRFNGSWTAWASVHDKTAYLNNVCSQLQVQINDLHSRIDSAVASYKFTDSDGNCQNLGSVDWNTVKRSGYFMGSGTTNAPENSGDWFMVKVMSHNSIWCEQIATAFATTQKRYIRYQLNGTWTAWRSL